MTKSKEIEANDSIEQSLLETGELNESPKKAMHERTFWDRIPRYRWWVTPLNILLICIFLIIIDIATPPNTSFWRIDWAWWPIGGLIFAYLVSFILIKRPSIAWIVGPILMVGTSGLLLAIDLVFPPNDGLLHTDWAVIPIAALLTFGVLIPIVTKLGRKQEKPILKFRKAVSEMEKQEDQNKLE
ncbi:MAG: hypothetical protein FK734_19600 [Asgard group archaeon]|nr:hypothetical protein [Asgard group archaeon]